MDKLTPKQLRMIRNLTQKQVADSLGISLSAYLLKERGERDFTFNEIMAFANLVEIELSKITPIYTKKQ